MATQAAIVIRRTTDGIDQLARGGSSMQLAQGQWGFAAVDRTLVIRDLQGNFHFIKTESAMLDLVLVKEPVQTAENLPLGDQTGTLRMVLDSNSYWFKTASGWIQMPGMEWIRAEIRRIEGNAGQIDASDNGNGSFTFTNYDGEEKIIQSGKRVLSADGTVSVAESADNFDLSVQPALEEAYTELEAELERISARMESLENLGHYAGSFPDFASLPSDASAFPRGITENDFATIREDETNGGNTTRYVVSGISGGIVTWAYDLTYSKDVSGKADKAVPSSPGNLASLDASGNLADSGKKASDFAPASIFAGDPLQAVKADGSIDPGFVSFLPVMTGSFAGIPELAYNKGYIVSYSASRLAALILSANCTVSGERVFYNVVTRSSVDANFASSAGWKRVANHDELDGFSQVLAGKASVLQDLAATVNTDATTSTGAVTGQNISYVLQTIWNKIRSVVNALAGKVSTTQTVNGTAYGTGNITISAAPSGNAGGDLSGTYPSPALAAVSRSNATSTASPGSAGTFTAIDSVSTDAKGRVTGANTKTVTMPSVPVAGSSAEALTNSTTGAAGSSATWSRSDHRHGLPSQIGSWTSISLTSNVSFATNNTTARVNSTLRLVQLSINFRLSSSASANAAIYTLPSGYFPATAMHVAMSDAGNNNVHPLQINTSGQLVLPASLGTSNTWNASVMYCY